MKININIENHGAFWIDYLDGNLSPEQEEALFAFLEQNPNIAGDLIDPDEFTLPIIEAEYPKKDKLKSEAQIENLLIAKVEGEISKENDKYISQQIADNKEVAHSYSIYKKTILVPDNEIVFPNKNSLKKTVKVPMFRYVSSVAAAIAIVFIAGYFLTRNTDSLTNGTPVQTSELKIVLPNHHNTNNNTDNYIEPTDTQGYTANNNIVNNNYQKPIDIPEKLPLQNKKNIEAELAFSSTNVMEYRYDVPEDTNNGYSYTMQYRPAKKENRFVAGIKKVVNFGKEVNVVEKWDGIKTAKEEMFFTSINE